MGEILAPLTARSSFTDGLYLSCGDLVTLEQVAITVKLPRKADRWKRLSGEETKEVSLGPGCPSSLSHTEWLSPAS